MRLIARIYTALTLALITLILTGEPRHNNERNFDENTNPIEQSLEIESLNTVVQPEGENYDSNPELSSTPVITGDQGLQLLIDDICEQSLELHNPSEDARSQEIEDLDQIVYVTYCRDNLDLFAKYYPEAFSQALENSEADPICLVGPAPPRSLILESYFYINQCDPDLGPRHKNRDPCSEEICHYNLCGSGCGPAVFMMAEKIVNPNANINKKDIYDYWDSFPTTGQGTTYVRMAEEAERRGILYKEKEEFTAKDSIYYNMDWEKIQYHISEGRPIIMDIKVPTELQSNGRYKPLEAPRYGNERFCGDDCPPSVHYILIKGIFDGGLIIDDPFTSYFLNQNNALEYGRNLVITEETFKDLYFIENRMIVLTKSVQ